MSEFVNNFQAPKILMIGDNSHLMKTAEDVLLKHECVIEKIDNCGSVEYEIQRFAPDIIIFDDHCNGEPSVDSIEAIKNIYKGPLIILGSGNDHLDEIYYIEKGADAYFKKNCSPILLLAKVDRMMQKYVAGYKKLIFSQIAMKP